MSDGVHRPARRRFLKLAAGAAATSLLPLPALALPAAPKRTLSFHNLHTGENLAVTYYAGGRYRPEALRKIDINLRDFRTGEVAPIDRKLLDLLSELRRRIGSDAPFHVISGYRSPRTNQALAAKGGGVAKRSLHMRGLAIDVRLPDRSLADLRQLALDMHGGGVGYYPKPGFVHLDVGRVRFW